MLRRYDGYTTGVLETANQIYFTFGLALSISLFTRFPTTSVSLVNYGVYVERTMKDEDCLLNVALEPLYIHEKGRGVVD